MKHFTMVGMLVASFVVASASHAVDIVWDGGDGDWQSNNWNGGQSAVDVFGYARGMDIGAAGNPPGTPVGTDAYINGGNVNFDAEILDDFRWKNDHEIGGANSGTLNLSGGAILTIDTAPPGDSDGHWSQFNTKALNIDNATLRRTFTATDPMFPANTVLSGGIFSFAGNSAYDGIDTEINLTNGGTIENDGILSYGWYTESFPNTRVAMTINDGHLDLTGGDNVDFLDGAVGGAGNADLLFSRGWDSGTSSLLNEDYSINFTGPGSIKVDHSGILIIERNGPDPLDYDFSTITTLRTYEDVWDAGILRAHGFSGLDGKTFSDFFTVTGTSGTDGYILTSNVLPGDFDANTNVDGTDFLKWQRDDGSAAGLSDWEGNFGTSFPLSGLSAAIVPEPASGVLLVLGLSAMLFRRRAVTYQEKSL